MTTSVFILMFIWVHVCEGDFGYFFVTPRLVEYLDESTPGTFRQAQVSFSSRIPNAFPICDALTMEAHLWLYCDYGRLNIRGAIMSLESEAQLQDSTDGVPEKPGPAPRHSPSPRYSSDAMGKNSSGRTDNTLSPNVLMLTKHTNGSLNLWQVTFSEDSHFTGVASIAHASRACGHRFHTSSAACHPVLPLLLTTSHHNATSPQATDDERHDVCPAPRRKCSNHEVQHLRKMSAAHNACHSLAEMDGAELRSELILWRVAPVGPLSKSGGITELARINSAMSSAFSNVSWLPTLLPRLVVFIAYFSVSLQ